MACGSVLAAASRHSPRQSADGPSPYLWAAVSFPDTAWAARRAALAARGGAGSARLGVERGRDRKARVTLHASTHLLRHEAPDVSLRAEWTGDPGRGVSGCVRN